MIPAWRPGRYELTNYARYIRNVQAFDGVDNPLVLRKTSRNCWQVNTQGSTTVILRYQYYAFQYNAGGSVLNDQLFYLNFINCLFYCPEQIDHPCLIDLQIDPSFKIACGLPRRKPRQLLARNYYHLVDSPLVASPKLKHWKFQQSGIIFNLWFVGSNRLSKSKTISAFKAFSSEQILTMGSFPEKDYHFLYLFPSEKLYHGVEHANSTVIVLGPNDQIHKERYQDFLGVSSHELFHSWNVLKIRPKELVPYDFRKEVYFETGFIAEGITTYYGDLFLFRSGVFDESMYFKELNTLFKRHFENEGRHLASLVESSRDLWVDGYQQGAPGRKVSIYTKGALVSLILDLTIRTLSNHQKSLDSVMRTLWKQFGQQETGYSLREFQNVCEQAAGSSLQLYFKNFIYGTEPLETELSRLLEIFGCRFKSIASKQLTKKLFGFRTSVVNQELTVIQILTGSPAWSKLSLGDIIVMVNGKKPKGKLNDLINTKKSMKLDVMRSGRKIKVTLKPSKTQYFVQYIVEKIRNQSMEQEECFKSWLHQTT